MAYPKWPQVLQESDNKCTSNTHFYLLRNLKMKMIRKQREKKIINTSKMMCYGCVERNKVMPTIRSKSKCTHRKS